MKENVELVAMSVARVPHFTFGTPRDTWLEVTAGSGSVTKSRTTFVLPLGTSHIILFATLFSRKRGRHIVFIQNLQ